MQDDEFATTTPSESEEPAEDAAEPEFDETDESTRPMRMAEVFDDE